MSVSLGITHSAPLHSTCVLRLRYRPGTIPAKYTLHTVMVHDGNDKGGHYYSYIRPNPEGDWFKFNDASVTRATSKEAIEDNFGDDEEDEKMRTNFSNAYMLFYVKDDVITEELVPVTKKDIPGHLLARFQQEEQEEQEEKEAKTSGKTAGIEEVSLSKSLAITHEDAEAGGTHGRMEEEDISMPWLHSEMTHLDASKLLAGSMLLAGSTTNGAFLVRKRTTAVEANTYALTVVWKGKPTHHLIARNSSGNMTIRNGSRTVYGSRTTDIGSLIAELAATPGSGETGFWPVALTEYVDTNGTVVKMSASQ